MGNRDHVTVIHLPDEPTRARIEGGFTGAAPTMGERLSRRLRHPLRVGFFVLFQALDF